ncbi:putative ABC-type Na+ efflux pump, permease component [Pseudoalteromonas luteoviolacea B = ATCC 29581]|nr:putative ABC-type Na+ efflux pump, permease component [Pseudoalteromonas luteoviolacea B = ATCC 29581]
MFEIYRKELLELLRDRKTLFFVIALPILIFPLIIGFMVFLSSQATQSAEQKVHQFALVNGHYAPDFAQRLFYHKSFKQTKENDMYSTIDDLVSAVKSGKIDVGVYIPKAAHEAMQLGEQTTWSVVFNDAKAINFIYTRIEELKTRFTDELVSDALTQYGVVKEKQEAFLHPISLQKVDTADKRENLGEKLGGIIPYLLIPLILAGAIYPAIDMGAGEKERGTLETLLLTPVSRTQLVLGKFLTLLTTSVSSAIITVASLGIWVGIAVTFIQVDVIKVAFASVGAGEFVLIFMLLLPVAAILSSLVLAISIYARTFKEAQNYMGPLNFLIILPMMASIMPNMQLSSTTALIPITNVSLAIKDIIKGTVDMNLVWLIFISTAVLGGILLAACVRWFSKESVLFR